MPPADRTRYLCEFIGTFILVFFAAGAVMTSELLGLPAGAVVGGLASGLALATVIRVFSDISGGHVNPALTFCLVWLGSFPKRLLPGYVFAQLAGSLAAGLTLFALIGDVAQMGANLPNQTIAPLHAFLIEVLLSFIMMLVIMATTQGPSPVADQAPLWIGAVVGIEVMVFGGLAGAAMNPARAFGPFIARGDWEHFWIYAIGPVIGIAAASWLFRYGATKVFEFLPTKVFESGQKRLEIRV